MAINYTWNIENTIYTNDENKCITSADVRVVGTEGDNTAEWLGVIKFDPDPSDSNFVPFDQLTQEQVVTWVKERLIVDEIEEYIANNIVPSTLSGVPW